MFIRIRNKVDNVNRLYLEKLGLSTKRDDDSTIGQFGSGSKYAPIYALRNGWQWINCGADQNGPYQMEYGVRDEDGINSIFFEYSDGTVKDSSFTLEAGSLTWEEPFQIFREAFANCLDSGYDDSIAITFVDEIDWEPGYFDVYLSDVPELRNIAENIDHYFSVGRESLFQSSGWKVYEPLTPGTIRVYSKGVLVAEIEDSFGVFDYEFENITLNEERRVKSEFDLFNKVSQVMFNFSDHAQRMAERYISEINYDRWEWKMPSYVYSGCFHWKDAWYAKYGLKACPITNDMTRLIMNIDFRGYSAITVSEIVFDILKASGVDTPEQILGEAYEFEIAEPSFAQEETLNQAIDIMNSFGRDVTQFEVSVFHPMTTKQENVLGLALMGDKKILLSTRVLDMGFKETLATLNHEYEHHISGYDDGDLGFRSFADKTIAELMIENHRIPDLEISDDVVTIPFNYVTSFDYKVHNCGGFGIAEIGGRKFMINGPCVESSGQLEVADNSTMKARIKTSGTSAREIR